MYTNLVMLSPKYAVLSHSVITSQSLTLYDHCRNVQTLIWLDITALGYHCSELWNDFDTFTLSFWIHFFFQMLCSNPIAKLVIRYWFSEFSHSCRDWPPASCYLVWVVPRDRWYWVSVLRLNLESLEWSITPRHGALVLIRLLVVVVIGGGDTFGKRSVTKNENVLSWHFQ